MAGLIKREDIDEVRRRTDIKEVVESYVSLKRAGVGSFKGLCPFHDERSPSFNVRPQHGTYHCFGCGEGGDVIEFLMKIDHTSFSETVEKLAGRIGYELHYEDGGSGPSKEEHGRRQRLLDAHKIADEFFQSQLGSPEALVARQFLAGRDFDRAAAEQFSVGYAPQGWDSLLKVLRGRGFRDDELKHTGMFSQGSDGSRMYDRFRGRLIWPIRDITGQTIGFGARKLYDEDQGPKYLNTPETPLYKKSQVLYGIDLARKSITTSRQLVVVEGYTDVMAAHLSGVSTAVATCGTAFGADHIRVARRLLTDDGSGGEVIFTFDGDAAGQKAALRAFKEDQRFLAQTYVAVEPSGADPCDLRKSGGPEAVRGLIDAKRPLFEFAIKASFAQMNLDTGEGQLKALRMAAPVVAQIRDSSLRQVYTRELSKWLGMQFLDHSQVERAVAQALKSGAKPEAPPENAQVRQEPGGKEGEASVAVVPQFDKPNMADPNVRLEHDALVALLQYPHLVTEQQWGQFVAAPLSVGAFAAVQSAMKGASAYRGSGTDWIEHVRAGVPDVLAGYVTRLAVTPLPTSDERRLGDYLLGLLKSLIAARMNLEKARMLSEMQRLDAVADAARITELNREIYQLELRRRTLREQSS